MHFGLTVLEIRPWGSGTAALIRPGDLLLRASGYELEELLPPPIPQDWNCWVYSKGHKVGNRIKAK